MNIYININDEVYKTFRAAIMLTGEDEEVVVNKLIEDYSHNIFANVLAKREISKSHSSETEAKNITTTNEQKAMFVNWFRSLTRNGRPYNPVTISGYTGRIENACQDSAFAEIPIKNLFSITDLKEFMEVRKKIENCEGYYEFDLKSHNGFTAALKKYEEFLRFQKSDSSIPPLQSTSYLAPTKIHRWTMEEDLICCKRFLEYYVIDQSNINATNFLQIVSSEIPEVSEGSLRMKMQNIKYLSIQAGFTDTFPLKFLRQCSLQNKKAFKQAINELNLV